MKPTYEELEARLRDSEARLRDNEARLRRTESLLKVALEETAKLRETEFLLKVALEEIAKLKEQLGRNSKNSSKPPSSDPKGNTPDAKPKPSKSPRAGKARLPFANHEMDRYSVLNFIFRYVPLTYDLLTRFTRKGSPVPGQGRG